MAQNGNEKCVGIRLLLLLDCCCLLIVSNVFLTFRFLIVDTRRDSFFLTKLQSIFY